MTRSRRGVAGLLVANGVSLFGTRMSFLALPWFVLATTHSPGITGVVAFAEMAPYVAVQGFGGPAIDRAGAWRTGVIADVLAAAAVGALPLLHSTGLLGLGALALLVALAGAIRGAGDSAKRVLVPGVAEHAGMPLERATGLIDGVNRLATMLGAPLAGVLIAVLSASSVLAVDAATFLVSAVVVAAFVPRAAQPRPATTATGSARGYLGSLREGFAHLRADRLLLGIAAMVFATNLLDQALGAVLLPVWASERLGSPVALGVIAGAGGVGAVGGNFVLTWLGPRLPRHRTYAWGFLVAGAPRFFVLAGAATLPPAVAIVLVCGVAGGAINPILGAVEYERVPRALQARVLGAVGALAWAGIPLGGLVAGAGVTAAGLTATLAALGGCYLLATLAPFLFPAWREMDRPGVGHAPSAGLVPADGGAEEGAVREAEPAWADDR